MTFNKRIQMLKENLESISEEQDREKTRAATA